MRCRLSLLVLTSCGRLGFDPVGVPADGNQPAGQARIAAGSRFTCVLRSDDSVWCWGSSRSRELGADSLVGQRYPTKIDALSGKHLVELAAGQDSACAIDDAGAVWCWGNNGTGELGQGTTGLFTAPVRVSVLPRPARQVSLGSGHVCAVLDDASAWCWGDARGGQVGVDIAKGVGVAPTKILADVAQISTGNAHTCALHTDGSVACWGTSVLGTAGSASVIDPMPHVVQGLVATALVAGYGHECALVAGGHYRCWGTNTEGEVGDPAAGGFADTPLPASTDGDFIALSAGFLTTCGLLADHTVRCWGDNHWGQTGDGTMYVHSQPINGGVRDAIGIASGGGHNCALHSDESVECWGLGASGELGDGHFAELSPVRVPLPATASAVDVGLWFGCAIAGGNVYCWGLDDARQLGAFSTAVDGVFTVSSPVQVAGVTNATALSAGSRHACAITTTGVTCWGTNVEGELGRGTFSGAEGPMFVGGLPAVPTRVTTGQQSTCVISSGQLWCWGGDSYGELGDGGGAAHADPTHFITGSFNEVSAGELHTCAISSGALSCWGHNADGEVGNGASGQNAVSPAVVTGAFVQVASGSSNTCARTSTNTTQCWGRNVYGELGIGDTNAHPTPATVPGLTNVSSLSAFSGTTCATTTSSGTVCWGFNTVGVFGDGSTNSSPIPVSAASGVATLTSIDVGLDSACGLTSAGDVYCWGDNSFGQLGQGTVSASLVPVKARFP